jgi:hypothetical protein
MRITSGSAVENIRRVVKREGGRRKRPSQGKGGEGAGHYDSKCSVHTYSMARHGGSLSDHVKCPIYTGRRLLMDLALGINTALGDYCTIAPNTGCICPRTGASIKNRDARPTQMKGEIDELWARVSIKSPALGRKCRHGTAVTHTRQSPVLIRHVMFCIYPDRASAVSG